MTYQGNSNLTGMDPTYTSGTSSSPTQPQKEIPAKLELIDNLLHELSEEALGMNGTFASVLATAPAAESSGGAPRPPHATQVANVLDSFATRIQQSISILRDIRSRCEL